MLDFPSLRYGELKKLCDAIIEKKLFDERKYTEAGERVVVNGGVIAKFVGFFRGVAGKKQDEVYVAARAYQTEYEDLIKKIDEHKREAREGRTGMQGRHADGFDTLEESKLKELTTALIKAITSNDSREKKYRPMAQEILDQRPPPELEKLMKLLSKRGVRVEFAKTWHKSSEQPMLLLTCNNETVWHGFTTEFYRNKDRPCRSVYSSSESVGFDAASIPNVLANIKGGSSINSEKLIEELNDFAVSSPSSLGSAPPRPGS